MSRKPTIKTAHVIVLVILAMALGMVYNTLTYDPRAKPMPRPGPESAAPAGEPGLESLVRQGRQPYTDFCAPCHRGDGRGLPGTYPALDGSPVVRGEHAGHIAVVLDGRPGTAMPGFRDQLSDGDIAAILTYERNAWLFKSFDAVMPAEVAAQRATSAAAR